MSTPLRVAAALLATLWLAGCASTEEAQLAPATVGHVDLQRYQGIWYELARLPMFFQRNCVRSEAQYRLQDNGDVAVLNRCQTASGQWQEASGRAWPQVPGQTDKLWVQFDNWFSRLAPGLTRGDYWVIALDGNYQTVLVGTPDRKFLWLLSRTATVAQATRDQLLAKAQQQGYDTTRLIWRQ